MKIPVDLMPMAGYNLYLHNEKKKLVVMFPLKPQDCINIRDTPSRVLHTHPQTLVTHTQRRRDTTPAVLYEETLKSTPVQVHPTENNVKENKLYALHVSLHICIYCRH